MRVAVLALALAAIALAGFPGPANAEPIEAERIHVLDGDTIRVDGLQPDVRLVGFNAPETIRAQCEPERLLGEVAARRLRKLVAGGGLDLRYDPMLVLAGNARDADLQLRAELRGAQSRRAGRGRNPHCGTPRGAVPLWRNPLPADAAAVVWVNLTARVAARPGHAASSGEKQCPDRHRLSTGGSDRCREPAGPLASHPRPTRPHAGTSRMSR